MYRYLIKKRIYLVSHLQNQPNISLIFISRYIAIQIIYYLFVFKFVIDIIQVKDLRIDNR